MIVLTNDRIKRGVDVLLFGIYSDWFSGERCDVYENVMFRVTGQGIDVESGWQMQIVFVRMREGSTV